MTWFFKNFSREYGVEGGHGGFLKIPQGNKSPVMEILIWITLGKLFLIFRLKCPEVSWTNLASIFRSLRVLVQNWGVKTTSRNQQNQKHNRSQYTSMLLANEPEWQVLLFLSAKAIYLWRVYPYRNSDYLDSPSELCCGARPPVQRRSSRYPILQRPTSNHPC